MDIDDFKTINDRFGHVEGDRILQMSAKIIKKSIREMDLAARYGGDEFLILFPNTMADELEQIAKRLKNFSVIISMGWATTDESCNIESLIKTADAAMYFRKETGKLGLL